jgi:chromosome segregation ATPase
MTMTDELAQEIAQLMQRNQLDGEASTALMLAYIQRVSRQVEEVNARLQSLEAKMEEKNDKRYVLRTEFEPVKNDVESGKSAAKAVVILIATIIIGAVITFALSGGLMTP